MGHALFADLEELPVLQLAQEVEVEQGGHGFLVGGREEYLAVNGSGEVLAVLARVVLRNNFV